MRRVTLFRAMAPLLAFLVACSGTGNQGGAWVARGDMGLAQKHRRPAAPRRIHVPSREKITRGFLEAEASQYLRKAILFPSGMQAPQERARDPRSRRRSKSRLAAHLNFRILQTVPVPREYLASGTRLTRRRHDGDTAPGQVEMIAMARFSATDCWLYPYVFTMQYDTVTGALLQETTALAPSAVAIADGFPEGVQVC